MSKYLKYEDISALLTSSPSFQSKVLTPSELFSPFTNPSVGCGVKVHHLGFPLSSSVSITRAAAVVTAMYSHTQTYHKLSHIEALKEPHQL